MRHPPGPVRGISAVWNWWALLESNQRPPPCEGDALPLSQAPNSGEAISLPYPVVAGQRRRRQPAGVSGSAAGGAQAVEAGANARQQVGRRLAALRRVRELLDHPFDRLDLQQDDRLSASVERRRQLLHVAADVAQANAVRRKR